MIRTLLSLMTVLAISMVPARAQQDYDEDHYLLGTGRTKIPSPEVTILSKAFNIAEFQGIPLDNYDAYIGFTPGWPRQIVVRFQGNDVPFNPNPDKSRSEKYPGFAVVFDRSLEAVGLYYMR
ncbi:hypothetical protein K1W69_01920 [Hoeflea sp. WL0058]|uniref:Uncharacterized protein n=1 Tax=Flavimaribacter sediminis TaxID=2865987 RepID=A0AAE2ZJ62_9HYPH|nr:hypothetical protein [Flavimaribacter sediminis]MBW8635926.1 hypothetical protein [Flavimaribacter sediminis]